MRKNLFLRTHPCSFLLLSFSLYQTPAFCQQTIDVSFANAMNVIFANVEKNRVPFGILRDYGMEFTELNQFNGTAALVDSNRTDINTFWDVYNTLVMSRIHTSATGFIRPGLLDSNCYNTRQAGRITLTGLYFNYSRFKDNAANNFITITSNKLYDKYVNGVWQNPYQSERAFVISPSINEFDGKTFQILLPANLWLTNNTAGASISINVNDGAGYRTLTPGTPINISYATTGYYQWLYRITVSGIQYFCHSKVRITDKKAGLLTSQ